MLRYDYRYDNEDYDACDVSEEQRAFVFALGLTNACVQLGK